MILFFNLFHINPLYIYLTNYDIYPEVAVAEYLLWEQRRKWRIILVMSALIFDPRIELYY